MDHADFKTSLPDCHHNAAEGGILLLGPLIVAEGAVEMGVNATHNDVLPARIDLQQRRKLLRLEAVAAHAGINFQMDLRHSGALGCHSIQRFGSGG